MFSNELKLIWLGFTVKKQNKTVGIFGRLVPKIQARMEIHRYNKLPAQTRVDVNAIPFVRFPENHSYLRMVI